MSNSSFLQTFPTEDNLQAWFYKYAQNSLGRSLFWGIHLELAHTKILHLITILSLFSQFANDWGFAAADPVFYNLHSFPFLQNWFSSVYNKASKIFLFSTSKLLILYCL